MPQEFLDRAADVFWRTDATGTFTYLSPAVEGLLGWKPAELVGRRSRDVLFPDDLGARRMSAIAEHGHLEFRARLVGRDGREGWFEHSAVSVLDEDGSVTGFAGVTRSIDSQVRNELALAASEQRFRMLAEHASDVVVEGDDQGIIKWISPSVERVLDRDPADLLGRQFRELVHPDDVELVSATQQRVSDGEAVHLEARLLHRDGSRRWMAIAVNPMFDEEGRAVGRVASWHDIDAEYTARELAAQSETQLRMVLENVADVAVHSVEGVLVWVSDNVERLLGYRPDELLGRPTAFLWHRGDLDRGIGLRDATYDGIEGSSALRIRRKDGEIRWVEVVTQPVDEPDGRKGAIATVRDITDRVRAEDAVAAAAERDRLIAQFASDVLCVMAPDFTINWITGNTEELLGWHADELVGRSKWDLFADGQDGVFEERLRALQHGEVVRGLARMKRSDGTERWVDRRTRGLFDPDGDVLSYVSTWRDAQSEMEYLAALSDSEREARSLAEQYEAARQEAVDASVAKTTFLSRMSHELRTPLNAVLGFAQLLEMDDLGVDQRASVQQILRGGRHLLELINEVLDIARIESGRMTLSPESVIAADVIGEAIELVRPLAHQYGIAVDHFEPAHCHVYVFVDRQRLIQILLNLLSNAIKYNRPGGSVSVRCIPIGDTEIAFEVADTGVGIAPDMLPRLFAPFDRLGAEATDTEGTGIGLALSRALAEIMRGRILVQSTVGVGSMFTVVVQRSEATHLTAPGEAPTVAVEIGHRATRVLYIEDNPANAALLQSVVTRRPNIQLEVAINGTIGLERALEWQPDLILLDLHLPDISGEDVLRRIRSDVRTSTTPVVVLTAAATHDTKGRVAALGADGYLAKPVDVRQVLSWLDDPLQGRMPQ